MKFSKLFTKTRKEAPRDETAKNAELLIRAGFVDKLSSGIYTYLPIGLRVLKKIEHIIREEINKIGGQEFLMPALHPKANWTQTGRWKSMDDLYKLKDANGKEFALGPTHEEVVVPIAKQFISSYRDLPCAVYQFQNKFRMELRAKAGLLRGREFIMKDLYSFHADESDFNEYYERVKKAYVRIFERVGIGEHTLFTYASGGTFSKYSHEFQTLTEQGEDTIYVCETCQIAINQEIIDEQVQCPECNKGRDSLKEKRSIEVGNIFPLKTKFSDPFGLYFKDKEGREQPVIMGCYGIGLGRLMGTIVEVLSDEAGIVWPETVAPYTVHLICLNQQIGKVKERADEVYKKLEDSGVQVLYDDREVSAGIKFADAELMGIPITFVVSEKMIDKGDVVEKKTRKSGEGKVVSLSTFLENSASPVPTF